jgi:hypothetical protein
MNAKVYTGTDHYAEALPLITKLLVLLINCILITINCSSLTMIKWRKTIYLAVAFDGLRTQTYGTTFLTHAPVGGSMKALNLESMVDGVVY